MPVAAQVVTGLLFVGRSCEGCRYSRPWEEEVSDAKSGPSFLGDISTRVMSRQQKRRERKKERKEKVCNCLNFFTEVSRSMRMPLIRKQEIVTSGGHFRAVLTRVCTAEHSLHAIENDCHVWSG